MSVEHDFFNNIPRSTQIQSGSTYLIELIDWS